MEPLVQEPQHNVSYEGIIIDHTSKTQSIAPRSGQHIEEPVIAFVESLTSHVNPLFTNPLGLPLIDPPSMRYVHAYSSYRLLPSSTTIQSFGMNPSSIGFPKGIGNLYFSRTLVVDIVGASSLPETSVTQGTPTQPLAHTSPFAHGSCNIIALHFPHMHTPSALLGHPIGQMVNSQVIHTTVVT
jgi:hypothetical protein